MMSPRATNSSFPGLNRLPMKKPLQHHVWQQYLRSWSVHGEVFCLQNDRIFRTGTPVLGVITDFYKLRPLTNEDLKLLHLLLALDKVHPLARAHHDMVLRNLLTPMLFFQHSGQRNRIVRRRFKSYWTLTIPTPLTINTPSLRDFLPPCSRVRSVQTLVGMETTTKIVSCFAISSVLSTCAHVG